jgi:small conductance mechanosensitive channel
MPGQKIYSLEDAYRLLTEKIQGWLVSIIKHLPNLVLAVLILVVILFLARLAKKFSHKIFGHIKNKAIENLLSNLLYSSIVISGILFALGILNLDKTVTSLLAGAGLIGLGLSFAFQDIAQNFIAGVSLAVRKPFVVGDTIEVAGKRGVVRMLNLRTTVIINSSGEEVFIPNKELHQNALINSSHGKTVRVKISFTVSYAEDIERVRKIIVSSLEMQSHILNDTVDMIFTDLSEAGIRCEARFYISRGEDDGLAKSNAIVSIKKAVDDNHIQIPK